MKLTFVPRDRATNNSSNNLFKTVLNTPVKYFVSLTTRFRWIHIKIDRSKCINWNQARRLRFVPADRTLLQGEESHAEQFVRTIETYRCEKLMTKTSNVPRSSSQ